jgi:hypothetical protein
MRPSSPGCRGGTGCMPARHRLGARPSRGHGRGAGTGPCRPGWDIVRRLRARWPGEHPPATTRRGHLCGHLCGRLCRCRGSSRPGPLDRRLRRCRVVATCRGLGGCPDTADPHDFGEPPDQTAATALTDRTGTPPLVAARFLTWPGEQGLTLGTVTRARLEGGGSYRCRLRDFMVWAGARSGHVIAVQLLGGRCPRIVLPSRRTASPRDGTAGARSRSSIRRCRRRWRWRSR